MKKLTVVIPAYNHASYLEEALQSIFNSEGEVPFVIVIDDGSKDNTADVVRQYRDIKYVYQNNQGAHTALNHGIELAETEYIAILNDDDIYLKSHLSSSMDLLASSGADLIVARPFAFGEGEKLRSMLLHIAQSRIEISRFGLSKSLLKINWALSTSSLVFKKSVHTKVGGFKSYRMAHDLDFILRSIREARSIISYAEHPTWGYRAHGSNSGSSIATEDQWLEIMEVLLNSYWDESDLSEELLQDIGYGIPQAFKIEAWKNFTKQQVISSKSNTNHEILANPTSNSVVPLDLPRSDPKWQLVGADDFEILIVGHSHMIAFWHLFDSEDTSSLYPGFATVRPAEGWVEPNESYWEFVSEIAKGKTVAILWGGNEHNLLYFFESEPPIRLVGMKDLPIVKFQYIPKTSFRNSILSQGLLGLESVIRKLQPNSRVIVLGTPPVKSVDNILQRIHLRQNIQMLEKEYLDSRLSDNPLVISTNELRSQAWLESQAIRVEVCRRMKIDFFPVPNSVMSDSGTLLDALSASDATHANRKFAEIYMQNFDNWRKGDNGPSL